MLVRISFYAMCRLDHAKDLRFMQRQPKRIILIRHAESVGNIDPTLYSHTPDNKLQITEKGNHQSYVSPQVSAVTQLVYNYHHTYFIYSYKLWCVLCYINILYLCLTPGHWAGAQGTHRCRVSYILRVSISEVQANL